jgi:hypothetical protein
LHAQLSACVGERAGVNSMCFIMFALIVPLIA